MSDINPWHPMTNSVDLKFIGKLGEEVNELSTATSRLATAIFRCIIQGVNECEPVTGKENKKWLEDEIADVEAGIRLCKERFKLDTNYINERSARKETRLREWHDKA
jgi:hypothetical protein